MKSHLFVFVLFYLCFKDSVAEEESESESAEAEAEEDSYSFHKFSGPVSGEVREVVVPNTNPHHSGNTKVDFVAKPDYSYTYGVHDTGSGNSHTHSESRDGDSVSGEYRVLQADGLVRIVRYTAHPTTGFRATVEYSKM